MQEKLSPPEVRDIKNANGLAQELIAVLQAGQKLDSSLAARLQLLLEQQKLFEGTEKVEEDLARKIAEVWEKEPKWKGFVEKPEVKERVDKMVASILSDLGFVNVHRKASGQQEDFSNYVVWSKDSELKFKDLDREVTEALSKNTPGVIYPKSVEFFENKIRTMLVLDIPSDPERQLVSYSIDSMAKDIASRKTDGIAKLFFSIKKDNLFFESLKKGEINPAEFIDAVLHASLVLSPRAENLLEIFSGGVLSVLIVDYSAKTITEYPERSSNGVVEKFKDAEGFIHGIRAKSKQRWDISLFSGVHGLKDRDYRKEFAEFIEG